MMVEYYDVELVKHVITGRFIKWDTFGTITPDDISYENDVTNNFVNVIKILNLWTGEIHAYFDNHFTFDDFMVIKYDKKYYSISDEFQMDEIDFDCFDDFVKTVNEWDKQRGIFEPFEIDLYQHKIFNFSICENGNFLINGVNFEKLTYVDDDLNEYKNCLMNDNYVFQIIKINENNIELMRID